MENTKLPLLSVSDFIALANQTFEYAYPSVIIEGEVASFKLNQGKYVFFDLKDDAGSVGCFMMAWQLRSAIEDGMKVVITAVPKLTAKGKFSLTVRSLRPSGEGSLKRSLDILREKLEKEGLFAEERKRPLPRMPQHIAVISSTQAAGYEDFIKILNDRWGGVQVDVAHVQVQGSEAPDQIIRALRYFNTREDLAEVIVLTRGGGSADDLSVFNDELLVREIAASRIPTLVGVGHETDTSLADLVADARAATPSNAAQIIVPDKHDVVRGIHQQLRRAAMQLTTEADGQRSEIHMRLGGVIERISRRERQLAQELEHKQQLIGELDPNRVLQRGYAIVRGKIAAGQAVEVETRSIIATMEVTNVRDKA